MSEKRASAGADLGRKLVLTTGEEFKRARSASGLSQLVVASAAGISRPQYGRIERGLVPELSIKRTAVIASVLGLEPTLRLFPQGDPVRDHAHASLLERLHARCHKSLAWRTEVPLPAPGDRRAWDALIRGVDQGSHDQWRVGVEAETRLNDLQALERKLALKERDGAVDWVVLLLLASRRNRSLVAEYAAVLRSRFPLEGRRALALLEAGAPLGANALILL
ncbi:MAG TPA: helix-turn-helix transcriptional regulator [Candidatus Limnocylindrales bacterium]|nr:helix-turn-helix transcriptional regulator [Candidatus Limnocylindrales bacterium]